MRSRQHEQPKATNDDKKLEMFEATRCCRLDVPMRTTYRTVCLCRKRDAISNIQRFRLLVAEGLLRCRLHVCDTILGVIYLDCRMIWMRVVCSAEGRWYQTSMEMQIMVDSPVNVAHTHIRNSFEKSWKGIPTGSSDLAFIHHILETEKWRYLFWLIRLVANGRILSFFGNSSFDNIFTTRFIAEWMVFWVE